MNKISFKTKTTIWITLLVASVCVISIVSLIVMSHRVAGTQDQQAIISAVERNVDEIEYKNGILEIENDFAFYANGVYCDVYSSDFNYINGEIPYALLSSDKPQNGELRKRILDDSEYYIYDTRLDFVKYEYEIDVFSGQIIKYEADVSNPETLVPIGYEVTSFHDGINTEQAVDIALSHAGVSRENATVLSAELPSYENRQVFKIEFTCEEPLYPSVWIRGVVPAHASQGAFGALNKAVIYIIPLFVILAALGAYLLSRRTIRPVEDITRSARAISSGSDLSKRIEIKGGSNEIVALADTFNDMLSRLQSAFDNEKRFTSDASHELRTPLAVIKAECEFALSSAADSEDKQEALASVNEQADKMAALVNALLSLSRTEQGVHRFSFENSDLSELVESVCDGFKSEKGITLNADIEKGINIYMDAALISRLLENLIGNALRYGRENGYINVSIYKEGKKAVLSVEDNGIGIKEEDLPKIWGRFYRGDASRNSDGFGLGLALVERIAALHGAQASVESEFGKGSKFIITFFEKT